MLTRLGGSRGAERSGAAGSGARVKKYRGNLGATVRARIPGFAVQ